MTEDQQITTTDICDLIGRALIASRLSVRVTAVSNAVTDGKFPARWYLVMDELCKERGITCPKRLFTFVSSDILQKQPQTQETLHDQSSSDTASNAA